MDEQFDKELKKRIGELFDNYDDSAADEGWLQLREKFPEKQSKRRAFVWMWWSAAALLLCFLGIGLWINSGSVKPENLAIKSTRDTINNNIAAQTTHQDTNTTTSPNIQKNTNPSAGSVAATVGLQPSKNKVNPGQSVIDPTQATGTKTPATNTFIAATKVANPPFSLNGQRGPQPVIGNNTGIIANKPTILRNKADSAKVILNAIAAQRATSKNKAGNGKTPAVDSVKTKFDNANDQQLASAAAKTTDVKPVTSVVKTTAPPKTIYDLFAQDKKVNAAKNVEKVDAETKRIRFEVYAATYFNYAKGSNNQVNAGAGFSSDIKLTKNLTLVTGVNIGQNTLSYSGNTPASIVEQSDMVAAASVPAAAKGLSSNIAAPTFKNYNASLVGLDIPVNLKYEFNPQKNDIYFSAGLSSGTFINESYTYQYNYPSFSFSSDQATKDETTTKSFGSFYFAKTLNLAFGLGYPLGKNHLVIEPFLKYPLDGMGAQQLKFGAGGLNLKFNFETPRRR